MLCGRLVEAQCCRVVFAGGQLHGVFVVGCRTEFHRSRRSCRRSQAHDVVIGLVLQRPTRAEVHQVRSVVEEHRIFVRIAGQGQSHVVGIFSLRADTHCAVVGLHLQEVARLRHIHAVETTFGRSVQEHTVVAQIGVTCFCSFRFLPEILIVAGRHTECVAFRRCWQRFKSSPCGGSEIGFADALCRRHLPKALASLSFGEFAQQECNFLSCGFLYIEVIVRARALHGTNTSVEVVFRRRFKGEVRTHHTGAQRIFAFCGQGERTRRDRMNQRKAIVLGIVVQNESLFGTRLVDILRHRLVFRVECQVVLAVIRVVYHKHLFPVERGNGMGRCLIATGSTGFFRSAGSTRSS